MSDLVTLIFNAALKESFYIGIELGLNLLMKLIRKLFNRCRVVDVLLVEGVSVIPSILRLVITRHVASRLDLDILLLPRQSCQRMC